jgi:hypothetical protein
MKKTERKRPLCIETSLIFSSLVLVLNIFLSLFFSTIPRQNVPGVTVRKATVYHSGRNMTIRDVVFRDMKTTPVTQTRDVHIRDKIIKDCILLGSPLTVGMCYSRIFSCLHLRGANIKRN